MYYLLILLALSIYPLYAMNDTVDELLESAHSEDASQVKSRHKRSKSRKDQGKVLRRKGTSILVEEEPDAPVNSRIISGTQKDFPGVDVFLKENSSDEDEPLLARASDTKKEDNRSEGQDSRHSSVLQLNSLLHAQNKLSRNPKLKNMSDEEIQDLLAQYQQDYIDSMEKALVITQSISEIDSEVAAQEVKVREEQAVLDALKERERLLKEAQHIQLENQKILGRNMKKMVEKLPPDQVTPQTREFVDPLPDSDDDQSWAAWRQKYIWNYVPSCTIQ